MNIWFTADTHFQHKFMADLRGIGRDKLEEHDEMLIEKWNSVITGQDEVFHLGDFSWASYEKNRHIFRALKGRRKHLVRGNHDGNNVVDLPWSSVDDLLHFRFNNNSFALCHYPMLTWRNAHKGAFHLHGHSHGNGNWAESTRLDVGVDTHDFMPYSLEEVLEIMATREYDFCDHHKGD